MATEIIQHHEPFDFESFFKTIRSEYVGLDYGDYSDFLHIDGEKHSFIGRAEWKNRVEIALGNAIASDEAVEIINRALSAIITIFRSSEAEQPVTMAEVQYLNEFITGFPENCEVVWGLAEDSTLGNAIKAIILVNIKE